MYEVLFTEQSGAGHVYVLHAVEADSKPDNWQCRDEHGHLHPCWPGNYHPLPGENGAVGCWSRLEDLTR